MVENVKEMGMIKSQLYLDEGRRMYFKEHIKVFRDFYLEKLYPNFENIKVDAEKYAQEKFKQHSSTVKNPEIDFSTIAEKALDESIQFYENFNIVHYTFIASSIASLYVIWEQQTRKFLYDEISHDSQIDFENFCTNGIKGIKSNFKKFDVDITTFTCWDELEELRLLNNVIKHGDGNSANDLYDLNEDLFKKDLFGDSVKENLDTTILEENLNISKEDFIRYSEAIIQFWVEVPERSNPK